MTESPTQNRPAAHRRTVRKAPRLAGRQDRHPHTQPAAGHALLDGIDTVLPRLTERPPTRQLVDDLRLALARTAARGDTCRVPAAADGVRQAADLLLAGSPEQARQALRNARIELVGSPTPPV